MLRDTMQRPLRDLRISVTDKCNFRCPYCMPIEIFGEDYEFSPKADVLSFEEIARLTRLFVRAGAEKLRLTGGEPLVRKGLTGLIEELAAIEGVRDLTLTTNGWFLPAMAQELKTAGLNRVTVSLDSLDEATFGRMNGRGYGPERVLTGIEAAREVGLTPVKVNVVVKRGENEDGLLELVERFRGTGVILRFIEFMDVGNKNQWKIDHVVGAQEIVDTIHAEYPLEPAEPNYRGEVARRYRFRDGSGEIGIIASITQPFCGDCTRARLSTDGQLYTCLFAGSGTDLRGPMRGGADDASLYDTIARTWGDRTDRYSEERRVHLPSPTRKVEMYQIGG